MKNLSCNKMGKNRGVMSFVILRDNDINTKKIIFCTNGFLRSLGIKKNYNFPITLTASMTRPLSP